MKYSTYTKLYDTCVRPICSYASGIWGFKNYERSTLLQRRACRYFLGVHRFAPNHAVEGDMGWVSAKVSQYIEMLRLWNRLISLPDHRITKKIFDWDISICNQNWASDVLEIFTMCNSVNIFTNRETCDLNPMQKLLLDKEIASWDVARYNKDKLRTYNIFKWNFGCEDYITQNLDKRIRSLVAQFRFGILPLQIEIGRYRNIPVENRTCSSCINLIEDEFHLLCECPLYTNARQNLFETVQLTNPDFPDLDMFDKFIYICINAQKSLGKFLSKALTIRTELIFSSSH